MPTFSFGGGLHLGVPCRGALLGRVEFGSISKRSLKALKAVIRSVLILYLDND